MLEHPVYVCERFQRLQAPYTVVAVDSLRSHVAAVGSDNQINGVIDTRSDRSSRKL